MVRDDRSGAQTVAFADMDVRIGATVDDKAAGFDTSSSRPLLLVGDTGRGKTTIARYLTRWWLADTARHAHIVAQTPSEWADLNCARQHPDLIQHPIGDGCRPRACLIVLDDLDQASHDHLRRLRLLSLLPLGFARTILTSHGSNPLAGHKPLDTQITCLGLVAPESTDRAEAAVLDGQYRLDWPLGTIPVIPDRRGQSDFPCHRWHTPAGDMIDEQTGHGADPLAGLWVDHGAGDRADGWPDDGSHDRAVVP